jgi:Ser/Thr protein kinase RdoA (MazF antagonist)
MSDTFPTLTSILEPGALGNWLSTTYPLADPVVCEFFRHGINDTYIVMSDESRYFFRVYRHGWRTDAQVAAEVDQLALLARHGIPVAAAVPDCDGALVQRLLAAEGLRPAILTHAAPGVIKKRPSDVECHRVGQLMAQIHHVWDVHPQHGHRPSWFSPELVAYPMATVGDQFGRF